VVTSQGNAAFDRPCGPPRECVCDRLGVVSVDSCPWGEEQDVGSSSAYDGGRVWTVVVDVGGLADRIEVEDLTPPPHCGRSPRNPPNCFASERTKEGRNRGRDFAEQKKGGMIRNEGSDGHEGQLSCNPVPVPRERDIEPSEPSEPGDGDGDSESGIGIEKLELTS
jgi:hypothetical protein